MVDMQQRAVAPDVVERLRQATGGLAEETVAFLQELVRIPTENPRAVVILVGQG